MCSVPFTSPSLADAAAPDADGAGEQQQRRGGHERPRASRTTSLAGGSRATSLIRRHAHLGAAAEAQACGRRSVTHRDLEQAAEPTTAHSSPAPASK